MNSAVVRDLRLGPVGSDVLCTSTGCTVAATDLTPGDLVPFWLSVFFLGDFCYRFGGWRKKTPYAFLNLYEGCVCVCVFLFSPPPDLQGLEAYI